MSAIASQAILILCFVAGKSGGHLLPCITKAEQVLQVDATNQAYLFSSGSQLDYKIMQKHPDIKHYVPAVIDSIPYKQPWLFPLFIFEMGAYFINSLYKLWNVNPTKIISFGGLNSIPVCLAGRILGIPFDLYELNVEPGQAVKFLSYFTDTVFICFSQTAHYFKNKNCVVTPYPVRFNYTDRIYNKEKLLNEWNLSADRKTILILGGSQGSVFVNQAIKNYLENDPQLCEQVQIIHQIGGADHDDYKKFYEQQHIPAVVFAYNEQLENFYNLADLIVCRAGAGTLFEVEFFKKQCIIIPLQTDLNDHQVQNAQAITAMYPDYFSVVLQQDCQIQLPTMIQTKLELS
ncbi:MAG: UDP-N-acetylglucosamine--N-acetylmuramyl-(pentapeptide) pyrophosphoryl-undecaprenol N-acetylglucosamine transferase [Candidatus Chromulinivorax sp.]|nr:UDP-N-acetylglucosamine--N-acetylmuramyl-(pentapeptide) pyrophosphoryl-undecaprenol N-acetylglucosamine transferase [Candidatus Chromulinivorax sp.]